MCSAARASCRNTVPDLDFVLAQGPMPLSDAEQKQLVIFMKEGLTDLSQQPVPPSRVPSGLGSGRHVTAASLTLTLAAGGAGNERQVI
jgi:hypothetical protein